LGISRKIYVLCTIGYKLHKTSPCHIVIPLPEKKILENTKNLRNASGNILFNKF
jgi:hypothetical protein